VFWDIQGIENIVRPPAATISSHGVSWTLSCSTLERLYNRADSRGLKGPGRLANAVDDNGNNPMYIDDDGMGRFEQQLHLYHWNRPEFKTKRVWFLPPLAFSQLISDMKKQGLAEMSGAWTKCKSDRAPYGYTHNLFVFRRPGGRRKIFKKPGAKRKTDIHWRVNIFKEVVKVVIPVNITRYHSHWFAVIFDVKERQIEVYDWLGGIQPYHKFAALVVKNLIVDEQFLWEHEQRMKQNNPITMKEEIWERVSDPNDPWCLRKPKFHCSSDQRASNTCGVRVCLLQFYTLFGIRQSEFRSVMNNEVELQESRKWIFGCIVKYRLIIHNEELYMKLLRRRRRRRRKKDDTDDEDNEDTN